MVASPLPARVPKSGPKCYVTLAFSGVLNAKRGERITYGCLTLAISGAQKRPQVLRNPYILGCAQRRGQNQKWLPHPAVLGGPKEGGSAQ